MGGKVRRKSFERPGRAFPPATPPLDPTLPLGPIHAGCGAENKKQNTGRRSQWSDDDYDMLDGHLPLR